MKMVQYIVISLVPDYQNETYGAGLYPARTVATYPGKMSELLNELQAKFEKMYAKFVKKNIGWIIPDYILNSFKSVLENEGNKEIQKWIDAGDAAATDYDPLVGETVVTYKAFANAVDNYALTSDGIQLHRQAAANMAGTHHSSFTVH